jgi:hypothetical protein
VDNLGFIVAGYLITVLSLAGYAFNLQRRARRASDRAARLTSRR